MLRKKHGHKRNRSEMDESTPGGSAPFTRSATEPLQKEHCFFCQKDDGQNRTENAGKALQRAVEIAQDQVLTTKLNNAISPSDDHAIDVRYHKECWTRHVFRVLRDDSCNQSRSTQTAPTNANTMLD